MHNLIGIGIAPFYLSEATLQHWVPKNKISLKHIGDRIRGSGYFFARKEYKDLNKKMINGAPLWLWRQLYENKIKWVLSKIVGLPKYEKFVEVYKVLGRIDYAKECSSKQRGVNE